MEVALTEEESSVLQQALRSYLSDLRMEISDTDNRAFRQGLRHERETLESVFAKLDEASRSSELRDDSGQGFVRMVSVWWTDQAPDG